MVTFKTPLIESQWTQLSAKNPRLRKVVEMAALFCEVELKKDIVLTCIYRTPEENAAVGGIPNSPHMSWEAADLRSSVFTQDEIARIVGLLNNVTFRNGKLTSMCHHVPGGADHFHIQVAKP